MYAPRVFFSMVCVLLVFAVAAYWLTGSISEVVLATIACALLLQVGYFVGILYLVRQEKQQRRDNIASNAASQAAAHPARDVSGEDDIHGDVARH